MAHLNTLRSIAAGLAFGLAAFSVHAAGNSGLPEIRTINSLQPFDTVVQQLEKSITENKMGLVAQASASKGAASKGIKIPGNAVLMVFRPDFAVRMLKASVAAGIEAPLRIYVTENADGTTSVSYRTPSVVFSPYRNSELDKLASELDPIFERIVGDAVQGR
ncbi:conserved exported hypothetical protein [Candidatus Accumulibacter aalborgensis]|uniref:DUF302 domain-containing protein n=1 Tax=Candidatus Accumulibacter aalborgensis TaxID=1860102 RepID=A0A1A8XZC6_9PROT|nr:DUF302 domain-containing protein [Candidatus Accumulibacter aalborgensis]SBT09418.1 conserved exported hypothetical protein [Candidatus Accumulibacter aalborgensis]